MVLIFLLINVLLLSSSLCYSFSLNHHHHIININGKINNIKNKNVINNEYIAYHSNSNYNKRKGINLSMVSTIPKVSQNQLEYLPKHPELIQGKLDNGFTYVILPNSVPVGRFEAHLEVLSGSAHELESQQGMAHLLEHVAYMGSPKRQQISGTGSRTNAYTDFHHTVFFAACPNQTPDQFWKKPMLPMAFDALLDVMTTKVEIGRLEQERAAVLSEASMVNKMEYRVECQVLSALHSENRISSRFPIGKENLIKKWQKEDVQLYHSLHYRPDNVILFVVGDVDVQYTLQTIKEKFGSLKPQIDAQKIFKESKEFPEISMQSVSRHFPPVEHIWSSKKQDVSKLIPDPLVAPSSLKEYNGDLPKARLFMHELLQSFSFHLFAKRPIESIVTMDSLKRDVMRRMALSALQIRFNVQQRQDPLFTFVDFNQLNWPREGCAVCSLDLTTDPASWKDAVSLAVQEIRRLGQFGLTESELSRYKQAILSEAEQSAAQCDQVSNEDVLAELMESVACGHTFMHPNVRLEMTRNAINSITVEEMNGIAKELCEHLSHINPAEGVRPAAIVACAPLVDRNNQQFVVKEEEVAEVIAEALKIPLEPLEDTKVPDTLLTDEEMMAKAKITPPIWVPLEGKAAKEPKNNFGIVQKRLANGLKVNLMSMNAEPQRVSVRLFVPGGRMLESKSRPGGVLIGSRTIQEGGAFLSMSREEVELFCIDHLVMVDILAADDVLIFDFQTVTTTGPGGKVTGLEAVMQVAHIILTDFKYEDDAYERARQGYHEHYDSVVKGLESACHEKLVASLTGGDHRFSTPNHQQIDNLDLEFVKAAINSQLGSDAIEVSISGDAPVEYLEGLALKYFGTVPARKEKRIVEKQSMPLVNGKAEQLVVYLPDSDERAMGYLAGPCSNKWGIFADGSTIADFLQSANNKKKEERWNHPLFGHVVLLVLQEVANRRLFSIVREYRRLTYDAAFNLHVNECMQGGYYTVSVTSSPKQVQSAIEACKEALSSLKGQNGITSDTIQCSKRTILNRYNHYRHISLHYLIIINLL